MKKTLSLLLSLLLVLSLLAPLCGCRKKAEAANEGLWADAVYTKDTELGSGAKEVKVEVKVEEKSVIFTLHTDAATVGEALLENDLIAGEQGDYGLYIKTVNGITADYDVDQHYWAFYIDGEYAMSGIDLTEIAEGAAYKLEYAK